MHASLTTGSAVRLVGSWMASPNPQAQTHELHVSNLDVVGQADGAVSRHKHTPSANLFPVTNGLLT